MTRATRTTLLSTFLCLSLAAVASAAHPQPYLLPPGGPGPLPKFGFDSYNVSGYGEVVTHVHWNSRAAQLGLEPGDTILRLNSFPLTYHGSWRDALREAVYNGGFVRLTIRDGHTGHIAYRQTYLPGCNVGPVTPKYVVKHGHNNHCDWDDDHGYPGPIVGPITPKSKHNVGIGGNVKFNGNNFDNIKKLVKKFDKD